MRSCLIIPSWRVGDESRPMEPTTAKPEATILSDLTGRPPEPRNTRVDLERLRAGQRWLTRTWRSLRDLDNWPPGDGPEFYRSLDAWDVMERSARDSGQLEGCPIEAGGCDPDAPVRCGHCARATVDGPREADEPEAAPGQGTLFGVGRGTH